MGLPNGQNLQDLFNQRFGANAYQNGLDTAAQAGQNVFNSRLQAAIDAITKQQAAAQAKLQKPLTDLKNASDYWNDPTNNADLHSKGAWRVVQDLQNDPELQAQLKAQGYDPKAIADQAYNVATDGKIKSASGFKSVYDQANQDAKANQAQMKKDTGISNWQDAFDQQAQQHAQKYGNTYDQQQKALANETMAQVGQNGQNAQLNQTQNAVANSGVGSLGDEIQRGLARGLNAATLGLPELAREKLGMGPSEMLMNRNGQAGMLDKGYDFAGQALPFLLSDGATSALGLGKGMAEKGIMGQLGQSAVKNAVSGGLVSAGVQGVNAAIDPSSFNWQNFGKQLALDSALGGVGGAALHGLGMAGGKVLGNQAAKLYQDLGLQKSNPEAFTPGTAANDALSQEFKGMTQSQIPASNLKFTPPSPRPMIGDVTLPGNQSGAISEIAGNSLDRQANVSNNNWFSADTMKQNPMVNFTQQGSNLANGRGILQDLSVPKAQGGAIRSSAENTLNTANQLTNAPPEGFNQRLLNVQQDMHAANQTNAAVKQEMQNAIQQQYEHLKGAGGKGTDSGVYTNGQPGNFKEQTGGRYSVSNNPKWYQDFYKANGRAPSDSELKQLAVQHVRNGFQDHLGNIPAWKPQDLQHVHDQIDEIHTMLQSHPEQAQHLTPILKSLEQDEARLTAAHKNALNGKIELPTSKSSKLEDVLKQYGHKNSTPENIANAYNQKQWFHGTGTANLTANKLDPLAGDHQGLFGHGVYMTDSPEIANGYANSRGKRTSTPTIYDAKVNMRRVLDLEKPIPNDAKAAIDKFTKPLDYQYNKELGGENHFSNIVNEMVKKGATTEEIIQKMRHEITDFSHESGIPTSEFVENFQDLVIHLKQSGYDGITHTGGGRTGHDPHRVLIALDPNDHYAQTGRANQITNFKPNNPDELLNRYKSDQLKQSKGNSETPNINNLYATVKGAKDPKNFDELIKMAQMEHNAANPGLKTMLRTDPKIKQQLDALNLLGKPSAKAPKVEIPTPVAKQAPKDLLKGLYTDRGPKPELKNGLKLGDVMKGLTDQKNYVLDTVKTGGKNISSMSAKELTNVAAKLEKQHELVSKGGPSNASKLAAIESDMAKVKQAGLKMNLQFFAEHAKANPIEAVREKLFGKNPDKTPQDIAREKAQINSAAKKLEEKGAPVSKSEVEQIQNIKDLKPWQKHTLTTDELIDKLPPETRDRLTKIYDEGKANHVDNYSKRREYLYNKVVKGLGINKGSKESALVQDYGEKTLGKRALEEQGKDPENVSKEELNKINESELNRLAGSKADDIRKADEYLRNDFYDPQHSEVNASRAEIYPNQPDKQIPKLDNYYHHFNELHGLDSFKNFLEQNHGIDPHLAGISQDTKPKTKWAAPWQKRGNGEYKSDAVGGALRYLGASSYATHIDPIAAALRNYADHFATASEGVKSEHNLKQALNMRADELTGKTQGLDRAIQSWIGRKNWNAINIVNSHIKKNKILGNLGSTLGVAGNIPAIIGVTKHYAAKALLPAMKDFASSVFNHGKLEGPAAASKFLKERYMSEGSMKFETNPLKKAENKAALLVEAGDKAAAMLAWHGSYQQALAKNLEGDAAIQFADKQARHLMAGRGIGERPLYQTSKITHMVAPFSLEVGQLWKILGKQLKQKDFVGLATFIAGSAVYNHYMQQIKGSATSYDPAGAFIEGLNDPKNLTTGDKIHGALANLTGETLSEIPGAANAQKALGLTKAIDKTTLFGNKSPDRFSSGTGAITDIAKPLLDAKNAILDGLLKGDTGAVGGDLKNMGYDSLPLVMPFGGSQAAKTLKGVEALTKGGAFNKNGQLEFPISASNPADLLQALTLGPNATQAGQKYFNEHGAALSPNDTQAVQSGLKNYDSIMQQRAQNAIKTQINKVRNDKTLDPNQKLQKIALLMQKMQQGN